MINDPKTFGRPLHTGDLVRICDAKSSSYGREAVVADDDPTPYDLEDVQILELGPRGNVFPYRIARVDVEWIGVIDDPDRLREIFHGYSALLRRPCRYAS